jgi:hypothetical protein
MKDRKGLLPTHKSLQISQTIYIEAAAAAAAAAAASHRQYKNRRRRQSSYLWVSSPRCVGHSS